MKRLSYLTLIFAILSLVFIILLVFLRIKFPPYPLVSYQDAFDVLTPLVLIPLYWLVFKRGAGEGESLSEDIAFLVLAVFWVQGQGMHLSANSINNLTGALAREQLLDITSTDLFQLIYFFDEHLSHFLWHVGMLGLAALLMYREWRLPAGEATIWWATILAGIVYGFTYACTFLEGQTVFLGLPFAVIVVLIALISQRKVLAQRPVLVFFFVTCLVAFLLFAGWWLYWGDFREIGATGII
jgi:hypothetical protein